MTPLKQLFRQPVRLFAIFLLVGMASAFICLSAGVFASAKATLAQIEERYVTIGVPTTETADVATEYNGLTLHHEESVISQDMWAYMDQLAADGTVIKGAYQQKYISAYCPSIQSVTSGKEDGTYAPSLDSPYNRAIMIVRVTSVDKTNLPESTELASVSVTASIENVVKMHPDYAVRSTLRLIIGCNSQEELDALDIRPGGRYLVFGSDYIDRDLELRTTLAGTHRCSVEDIDLSRISYDLTEDEKKTASPDFLPIAKYSSGEKTTILGQDMVDAIDSCTMTVNRAGYIERCKSGSWRGWCKPTIVIWQGGASLLHFNTGESRGRETSHSLNYQKLGKELASVDELAVLDGGKCILQLRGVRPFLSEKYDITKHPNYKYLSDADRRNTFDIEKFLSTKLKVKPEETYDSYEVAVTEELSSV